MIKGNEQVLSRGKELLELIDKIIPKNDLETIIDDSREIFKNQLRHTDSLNTWFVSKR